MLENLKSLVWTGGGQGILFAVVVYVVAGLVGFKIGFQCFELSGVSSPSFVLVEPSTTRERVWYNRRYGTGFEYIALLLL